MEAQLALEIFQAGCREEAGYLCTPQLQPRRGFGAGFSRTQGRSVAIITLYKAQDALLRRLFLANGIEEREVDPAAGVGSKGLGSLRIMTVDQSQGSEADVVILSCVRSNSRGELGFAKNKNRLNVAVSRAKERLVIVGDRRTMTADARWSALAAASQTVSDVRSLPAMGGR